MSCKKERIYNILMPLLLTACMALLILMATYSTYRWVVDVEYREPYKITAIGQCEGGNASSSVCISRSGRTIVRSEFPVIEGQVVYRKCILRPDGSYRCTNKWYRISGGKDSYLGVKPNDR